MGGTLEKCENQARINGKLVENEEKGVHLNSLAKFLSFNLLQLRFLENRFRKFGTISIHSSHSYLKIPT